MEDVLKNIDKLKVDMADYTPEGIAEEEENTGRKKAKSKTQKAKEKAEEKTKAKDGLYKMSFDNEEKHVNSLKEVLSFVKENGKRGMNIQRYKGLGEMNPQQLWETTMDPEKRTLLKVTVEDAVEADEMFTILMGDQVQPRREFIETHALNVRYLDV
jgi:DNA gyrase subunit B